jgi:hypothetical protein
MRRGAASGSSTLDQIVERFRDRWETDGQYRTRVSAVAGAATLMFLCTLVAVVSLAANAAFGGAGASNGGGQAPGSSGPGQGYAGITFPTPTVPPWTPQGIPNAPPAPNSGTPPPRATKVTTATPGGYGTPTPGGIMPTTCNGSSGKATWALNPCPQLAGQSGTLSISAPGHAGAALNVVLSFGVCANNQNCTLLFTPSQGYQLNASATASIPYTVPAAAANNTAPISGMIQVSGGPTMSILAAPVQ